MIKKFSIFLILLICYSNASADYKLPSALTNDPFNCSGSGSPYTCSSSISIPEESKFKLNSDITLNITGDFTLGKDFEGVTTNGYQLTLVVDGNVTINKESTFSGNIFATGDITIKKEADFVGNISAKKNIHIEKESNFNGDISAGGSLVISKSTTVDGNCSPSNSRCTGTFIPADCDIFADNFNSTSYSNQDGTADWSSDWSETNDDDSPNNGEIRIRKNILRIENRDRAITRNANLSEYSTATLTFNYHESKFDDNSDSINIEVQGGGNGWTSLQKFAGSNVGSGRASLPISSSFLDSNFQIRFITSNTLGEKNRFYVDNLRIEACSELLPLAEWHFDESSWSGVTGEVVDTQGTLDGTAVNGATTGGSKRAIAGTPGTCRYGMFDGEDDYVDLNGMPELTGSFTISAWIYANETGNDQRIFVDDQNNSNGFGLSLGDGGNGQLRFFSRSVNPVIVDTQNAVISAKTWYHVAAVHDISAKTRQIYVNGTAATLSGGVTAPTYTGEWDVDTDAASIGGENNNAGEASANFRFNGNIDEVRVYDGALSAGQINTVMNETHPCPLMIHHFNINVGAGAANTCTPFEFTITAEDSSNNPVTDYYGTIFIKTSTENGDAANGNFSTITATNNINPNPDNDDNGSASYAFDQADNGSISLALTNNHSQTLIISVVDSLLPHTLSSTTKVFFSNSGFVISDADTTLAGANNIPVAGREHNFLVQKKRRSKKGRGCIIDTNYDGDKNLQMWRSKNKTDPSSNSPTLGGYSLPDAKPETANGKKINFVRGEARLDLKTTDIGRYRIELADISNRFPISGTSAEQTIRPFGLAIDNVEGTHANDKSNTPDGKIFATAGANFSATVKAVLWDSADDSNSDGIIDAGHSFNDNNKVPSFAWDTLLDGVTGGYTPAGSSADFLRGVNQVANLTKAEFSDHSGTFTVTNLRYAEVGSFTLRGDVTGFLGAAGANFYSDEIVVGRFIPASFELTTVSNGTLENACGSFNYIGQEFGYYKKPSFVVTAMNALPEPTATGNYTGSWSKLTTDSFSFDSVTQDSSNKGADGKKLDIVYTKKALSIDDNEDGSFNVSFGADSFCYGLGTPCVKQSNAQVAEFTADIDIKLTKIHDDDVITENIEGIQVFSPAQLLPETELPGTMRFGRLAMENVFGSELIGLTMPMRTQYFDGSNYLLNAADNCTTLNTNELEVTPSLSGGTSTVTVISTNATAGVLDISLTAPGAGKTGYIDVTPDLKKNDFGVPWLQYDWNSTIPGLENPTGRATFGIYNGNPPQIYIRQIH